MPASSEAGTDENVALTPLARVLASATTETAVPFDAARVAELRAAIAAGKYPIDNQRLADKFIALEWQLS